MPSLWRHLRCPWERKVSRKDRHSTFKKESNSPSQLYKPLETTKSEIRLLKLIPNSQDGGIECMLFTVSLKDTPKLHYVSVSYVWGDPDITEEIRVDGQPFRVTTNLASLFRHLKKLYELNPALQHLELWVDAICINQADIIERNSQVELMADIYQGSGYSISWLGAEENNSELALRTFREFSEQTSSWPLDSESISNSCLTNMSVNLCQPDEDFDGDYLVKNHAWLSIQNLLSRPYWERIWTFQELVLPKKVLVMCGLTLCSLEHLTGFAVWFEMLRDQETCPEGMDEERIWKMISSSHYFKYELGLAPLTRIFSGRLMRAGGLDRDWTHWEFKKLTTCLRSTDARDAIYGLMGMIQFPVRPDYNKPVREVYMEYAVLTATENYSDFIKVSGYTTAESLQVNPLNLPSWVPDWSTEHEPIRGEFMNQLPKNAYSASKDLVQTQPRVSAENLYLSGIFCDKITLVEPPMEYQDLFNFACLYLQAHDLASYPTGMPPMQVLFRVLLYESSQPLTDKTFCYTSFCRGVGTI